MQLGLGAALGLVVSWFTTRILPHKDFSVIGDLLLGLFGVFVGLGVASSVWHVELMDSLDPATLLVGAVSAFVIVALTRLDARLFKRKRAGAPRSPSK